MQGLSRTIKQHDWHRLMLEQQEKVTKLKKQTKTIKGLMHRTLASSEAAGTCSSNAAMRSPSKKPDMNWASRARFISGKSLPGAICSSFCRKNKNAPQAWWILTESLYDTGVLRGSATMSWPVMIRSRKRSAWEDTATKNIIYWMFLNQDTAATTTLP